MQLDEYNDPLRFKITVATSFDLSERFRQVMANNW